MLFRSSVTPLGNADSEETLRALLVDRLAAFWIPEYEDLFGVLSLLFSDDFVASAERLPDSSPPQAAQPSAARPRPVKPLRASASVPKLAAAPKATAAPSVARSGGSKCARSPEAVEGSKAAGKRPAKKKGACDVLENGFGR